MEAAACVCLAMCERASFWTCPVCGPMILETYQLMERTKAIREKDCPVCHNEREESPEGGFYCAPCDVHY